jgi:WD40 repeat protein
MAPESSFKRAPIALGLFYCGAVLVILLGSVAPGSETQLSAQDFLSARSLVWGQKWDCGNWQPLGEPIDPRSYIESFTPDGKRLGMSVCESCRSVRIIDCDRSLQRLLRFRDAMADKCTHRWKPGVTRASLDPMGSGDMLFAVYDGRAFAVRLRPIRSSVEYEVAEVPPSIVPSDVNVATLKWEQKQVKNMSQGFMVGGRCIYLESVMEGQRITFSYDHYYGYLGSERGLVYEKPVFVAIVHKGDMGGPSTVDMTRFHFKTWEDGLSNVSDPGTRLAKGGMLEDGVPSDYVRVDFDGRPARGQVTYKKLHQGVVWKVAGAADGTYLASAGHDGQVVIYYLDRAITKVIGPFDVEDARFFDLAVSPDGAKVAAGGTFDHSILVVDVAHDQQNRIGLLPRVEGVNSLQFCGQPLSVALLTSAPELLVVNLVTDHVFPVAKMQGDLFRSVFSPSCEFAVAVVGLHLGTTEEVYRLLVLDNKGQELMSLALEEPADAVGSAIVFLGRDRLGLCVTRGGMMRWQWSARERKWQSLEKLPTPPGYFSAAITSEDGGRMWLAEDARVLEVDVNNGRIVGEISLEIGESLSTVDLPITPVPAITDLAFIPRRNMLVAALRDGRVALIDLSKGKPRKDRESGS